MSIVITIINFSASRDANCIKIANFIENMMPKKEVKIFNFHEINLLPCGYCEYECEKKGDASAKKVVDTYVKYLGESILSMLNIFRPEAFIIGGGISAQGDNLINRLKAYCEKFDYGYKDAPRTEILIAKLGNDAGIIGAAALV